MKKTIAVLLITLAALCSVFAAGTKESTPDTKKSEGVMTYAEYDAAELDSEVVIEAYVQAHQSWWNDTLTIYLQDADGGYFAYNCACDKETADKLVAGTKVRVKGYKAEWAGEVEIVDGTLEILPGSWTAKAEDVSALLGTADLQKKINKKVAFKGMKVEDSNGKAFLYAWDGSGSHDSNSDLYFNVSLNGKTYNFCVESYLCDNTTDVYAAVESLKVGDTVDLEGFLYWYNDPNPHITSVVVK